MKWNQYNSAACHRVRHNPGKLPAELFTPLLEYADELGPHTSQIFIRQWIDYQYQVKAKLSGFLGLAEHWGEDTFETACSRALYYNFHSLRVVKTILTERLYLLSLNDKTDIYGQMQLFDFL